MWNRDLHAKRIRTSSQSCSQIYSACLKHMLNRNSCLSNDSYTCTPNVSVLCGYRNRGDYALCLPWQVVKVVYQATTKDIMAYTESCTAVRMPQIALSPFNKSTNEQFPQLICLCYLFNSGTPPLANSLLYCFNISNNGIYYCITFSVYDSCIFITCCIHLFYILMLYGNNRL